MTKHYLTDDKKQRELNNRKPVHHTKRKKRNKEKLSEQDIYELMGMNMDKYQRVKGRVKRK